VLINKYFEIELKISTGHKKENMKKIILLLILLSALFFVPSGSLAEDSMASRLKGRLLLQVEQHGEIWYVNPIDLKKYQVTFDNALSLFQRFALGIKDADLIKIPANLASIKPELDSDGDGYKDRLELQYNYSPYIPGSGKGKFAIDKKLAARMKGRLLLQVEQKGAIWYVDHIGVRYSVRWDNLMDLFRGLALGIKDSDLAMIGGEQSYKSGEEISYKPSCTANWQCGEWSYCDYFGKQKRTCSDASNCGTTQNKPAENQSCQYQAPTGAEPIVFAINKSYADKLSDWKERADKTIAYINNIFLKTTKKEYRIEKYLVYNDLDYEKTWNDPNFHVKWSGLGTTAIILLIHKAGITVEELKEISPSNIVNGAMDTSINGVSYHNILIAQSEIWNVLLGENQELNYQTQFEVILHELGHTCGLAVPDWYLYSYKDCTHTEPLLPKYDLREVYPQDPMTASGRGNYQFSEFNSKIINMNLDHRYGYMDINQWFAKESKVYVTDATGNPIENAQVKIFCVKKSCFYCSTTCGDDSGVVDSSSPEQVVYTDSAGYATYNGPEGRWDMSENPNTGCLAKAIKVYYEEKSEAKYVNFLDLQMDYVLYNKQTHIDNIILD